MLGYHENFPANLHRIEGFNSTLSVKQLQYKLLSTLHDLNKKEFTFEEVATPAVPEGTVIFEFGVAKKESFCFLNKGELELAKDFLAKERVQAIDFFCSIRYYKKKDQKRSPLKFDYYLLRTIFGKELLEVQVFHERGPRHINPEDLVEFIVSMVNAGQNRKILKHITT